MFKLPSAPVPSKSLDSIVSSIRTIIEALDMLRTAVSPADLTRFGVVSPAAQASATGTSPIGGTDPRTDVSLGAETTARQAADVAILAQLTTERSQRIAADSADASANTIRFTGLDADIADVEAALAGEVTARTAAVTGEALLRAAADALLAPKVSPALTGVPTINGRHIVEVFSQSGPPTATEIAAGAAAVVKDTAGGTVKLYYNDAGTLKSVALA